MKTWSTEEVEILINNYNSVTNTKLHELLPEKSPLGIYKKAYKLGMRKDKTIEVLNRSESKTGEKSYNWNGGKYKNKKGYVLIKNPKHCRADTGGYVFEHILVWEKETGIAVPENCCIHHLNGNKSDNRIENLSLMKFSAHTVFHHQGAKRSQETKTKISEKRKEYYVKRSCHNGQDLQ